MPAELEQTIRAALRERAEAVVPLRTEPESRHRRRWLPAALAAAAVIVVAATVSLAANRDSTPSQPAAGSLGGFVGYQWRVTSLQDRDGVLDVPSGIDATVGFTADGRVVGDDTVNYLGGAYEVSGDGYHVTDATSTLVGYGGRDPARVRVIYAVDALFFTATESAPAGGPVVVITAQVDGDTLTLHTNGIESLTVTLTRAGVQDGASVATATPSSTATG